MTSSISWVLRFVASTWERFYGVTSKICCRGLAEEVEISGSELVDLNKSGKSDLQNSGHLPCPFARHALGHLQSDLFHIC